MDSPLANRRSGSFARIALDVVLVTAVVAAALAMRYADPLSSSVMPAEDPFTHLVFTREHVDNGFFGSSYHLDTGLYPPGLHAFTAVFWMLSGVDLYAFMLYAAPLFGGLAAAGMFLVGRRFAGPAAGVAAGILTAFIPEHVFRSNLYVPSAFDLALIPFLILAFMGVAEGARAWLVPGVLIALALLFAHPWVIPLTLVPVLLYLVARPVLARLGTGSRAAAPRDASPGDGPAENAATPRADRARAGLGVREALIGGVAALVLVVGALRFRWDNSDSGFQDFNSSSQYGLLLDATLAVLNPLTLALLAVVVGAVWWLAKRGRTLIARGVAALGVAGFLAIAIPTLTYSPPLYVDYAYQLGWLPITLAFLGLVVWPFTPANRVTLMGAAVAAVTFPLTAINVFNSEYLPHRTVAYLSVGVALLGAGLVATLTHGLHAAASERRAAGAGAPRRVRVPRALGGPGARAATALAVAVLLGAALAGPGAASPDAWYRYHTDEEFEGFRFVQDRLEEDPDAVAVAGDWRANMLLKSLSPSLGRALYSEEYYTDAGERSRVQGVTPGPTYVVVDKYMERNLGAPNFVHDGSHTVAWEGGDVVVYVTGGGGQ